MLQHKLTIVHNPFKYLTYTHTKEISEMKQGGELCLTTSTQLQDLLNLVYLLHDPHNEEVYTEQRVTMDSILEFVRNNTKVFKDISPSAFNKWCMKKNLDFIQVENKRIRTAEGRVRVRNLYVAKQKYISKDLPMIDLIKKKTNVCLITLEFAGLSTNFADLSWFLQTYPQIKTVMVDTLPYTNDFKIFESKDLLANEGRMKQFLCRTGPYRRSKSTIFFWCTPIPL
ncbi:hypothetical protein [Absidia glauca]|uniref:Uncharacterized protein n=1 Tax=Absidia glauca TaxID=4829 RepID=A0A163JWP9_ABSGL|nr:hypothetical protein [Absidia glauca]